MNDANRKFYTDLDRIVEALDFEGIPTQEVYDSYVAWCGQNGYRAMNNTNFGKEVKRAFPQSSKARIRQGRRQIHVYKAVAAMDESQGGTAGTRGCAYCA